MHTFGRRQLLQALAALALTPLPARARTSGAEMVDRVGWQMDVAVPMLYEMSSYTIRSLLELVEVEQLRRRVPRKIAVYPGVSRQAQARRGELASAGWVYYDLQHARDLRLEKKEEVEDTNFALGE